MNWQLSRAIRAEVKWLNRSHELKLYNLDRGKPLESACHICGVSTTMDSLVVVIFDTHRGLLSDGLHLSCS